MFRSMKRGLTAPALALLGALALGACDDEAQFTAPDADAPEAAALDATALAQAATAAERTQDGLYDAARRERTRNNDRPEVDRVGLAVEFGASSIDLATSILEREGATERQRALLAEAKEKQRAAEAALDAGDSGLAIRLARAACWGALKAWVAPDGVTREEADKVDALAVELITEAAAVVGSDDGVRGLILSWAVAFYTSGHSKIEEGQIRGVVGLWKGAVLAYFLID